MRSFFRNKPIKEPITNTHELLRQIERKDAAFRVTQFIFFVVALAFLGALLASNYRLQSENTGLLKTQDQTLKQEKQALDTLKENDKHTAASFADLQQHIDCIVNLFTQPNRASLTITNIQSCQLSTSSSGGATGSTKSGLSSGSPQTNTQKQTPAPSNNSGSSTEPPTQPSQPTPGPLKRFTCTITLRLLCIK